MDYKIISVQEYEGDSFTVSVTVQLQSTLAGHPMQQQLFSLLKWKNGKWTVHLGFPV